MDLEEATGPPGVLGRNQVGSAQDVERAEADVAGIADRRGDQVKTRRQRAGAAEPAAGGASVRSLSILRLLFAPQNVQGSGRLPENLPIEESR